MPQTGVTGKGNCCGWDDRATKREAEMTRLQYLLFVLTLVVSSIPCGSRAAETNHLTLWHDFPVQDWQKHAFFQGSGRLGCAVYGGVGREVIQFNEDSLWTGGRNPSGDYETMGAYQNFGQVVVQLEQDRGTPKLSCTSGQIPHAPQREKIEHSVDGDVRTKWCVMHKDRPLVWQVRCQAIKWSRLVNTHSCLPMMYRIEIRKNGHWRPPTTNRPG